MVKKYADLYLDARKALLPKEGQFASNVASAQSIPSTAAERMPPA